MDAIVAGSGLAKEASMKMFSLTRFLRQRRAYRTVLQELANYSDHELHDIGIDRVDLREIARSKAQEQQ